MARYVARVVWIAVALWGGSAGAIQQVRSLYTAVNPGACEVVADGMHRGGRLCEGLPGYPIYVAESGGRAYLSVGRSPEARRAARQTLNATNSLFDKNGQRPTVEWRFVVRDAQTVPYATIVRYFTRGATGTGEVLVVTRVTEGETCHVAYIDALANPDAIVLARRLADKVARRKPCPAEPIVKGAVGRSPM